MKSLILAGAIWHNLAFAQRQSNQPKNLYKWLTISQSY